MQWHLPKTNVTTPSTTNVYDEIKHRLLLPHRIYMVKGEELPIYTRSMIADGLNIDSFRIAIENKVTANMGVNGYSVFPVSEFHYFDENLTLKEERTTTDFSIYVRPKNSVLKTLYEAPMKKVVVDPATKTGRTIGVHCIGDSITAGGIPTHVKRRMQKYGITTNLIGTIGNGHEGTSSMALKHFVGANGTWVAPHMKLATAADKTNYPDWCFRRTGASTELSYTTDPVKTGDFYIFDFADYLTKNSLAAPDVITIALGTNDNGQDATWAMNVFPSALAFMMARMREALPTVKIGYIPPPTYALYESTNNENININSFLIEKTVKKIEEIRLTDPLVDIVPVWISLNREFNYATTVGTQVSEGISYKKEINNNVHIDGHGYETYVIPMCAYIVNVV